MKLTSDFEKLLSQVSFNHWEFYLGKDGALPSGLPRLYLQVQFMGYDNDNPNSLGRYRQFGRKWFLSPCMTDSEVIGTAFKAVLTAMEHETREQFRYKGRQVYGPHFNVEDLVAVCDTAMKDARDETGEMLARQRQADAAQQRTADEVKVLANGGLQHSSIGHNPEHE